jgi:UDP-2,4-diacetamido-2,4,6-trideoxy-beta-L-altropyranose hydrolase
MEAERALLIRADAGTQMGTGHVMRCLALAQAWQEARGQPHVVMSRGAPPTLLERLCNEGIRVHLLDVSAGSAADYAATVRSAQAVDARWVVVDGYHFDTVCQRAIKDAGLKLLFIDDYGHADHYHADLVLNQNVYADESLYANREPHTRLLLGSHYALLRREFWPWRNWRREVPPVARKVLVTLGGGDPENQTLKVIQAMQRVSMDGLEAKVIVGASNPHCKELRAAVQRSRLSIQVVRNASNMSGLMAWADVAISAAGSTCLELAFMGLPNLAVILADNQEPVAVELDAIGIAINLGWSSDLSSLAIAHALKDLANAEHVRAAMARNGRGLVDGDGAHRVATEMQEGRLRFRAAQLEDCDLVWEWANDPTVRAASFSSDPIPWEQHVSWFSARLADLDHLFYIVLLDTMPVGEIRYQLEGQDATVSVSLAPKWRGRGYGAEVIRRASRRVLETTAANRIVAYVKPENIASMGAFVKAGFAQEGTASIRGQGALRFVLQKDPRS